MLARAVSDMLVRREGNAEDSISIGGAKLEEVGKQSGCEWWLRSKTRQVNLEARGNQGRSSVERCRRDKQRSKTAAAKTMRSEDGVFEAYRPKW